MKTWKKIDETRRRATDVTRLRVKNDERTKQKTDFARHEHLRQQENR
jgi:hypothetical protein